MKRYLLLAIVASAFISRADAQPANSAGSTNYFPVVVVNTNELSAKDLQEFLQIKSLNFNIHPASVTNGVNMSLEVRKEGGKTKNLYRYMLRPGRPKADEGIGTNLNIILIISPTAMDDGFVYSAKQFRVSFKTPDGGFSMPKTIQNPLFNFDGEIFVRTYPYANPEGEVKLLEGNSRSGSPKQRS